MAIGGRFEQNDPITHAASALENAMNAVTNADNIGEGILAGTGELAKGGLTLLGDASKGVEDIVSQAPEPVKDVATVLLGAGPTIGKAAGRIAQADDPLAEAGEIAGEAGKTLTDVAGKVAGEAGEFISTTGRETVENIGEGVSNYLADEFGIDPNDLKTGVEGLGKAAGLGALSEIWGTLTRATSSPISTTANTIEQLMNIDNKRSI